MCRDVRANFSYFLTGTFYYRLNGLTVANRVHILEPQWNPSVEKQATGRLLRLGQQKQVTVVQYAMEKSIEEVSLDPFEHIP